MTWRWLTPRAARAIHRRQIQRHGGSFGLGDEGMLESAIARPQNRAAYGEPAVFELAASLAFGIARNHPFVDGNKRTAFVASVLFLRQNGYILSATQAEAAVMFLGLAAGEVTEDELAVWFERNCTALQAEAGSET